MAFFPDLIKGLIVGRAGLLTPPRRLRSVTLLAAFILLQSCGPRSQGGFDTDLLSEVAHFSAPYYIGSLAFSPDGPQLAFNTEVAGHEVFVWNWRDGGSAVRRLDYGAGPADGALLSYSSDGRLLAVGHNRTADNRIIRVWNTRDYSVAADVAEQWMGYLLALTFGGDDQLIGATQRVLGDSHPRVEAYDSKAWRVSWGLSMDAFTPRFMAFIPGTHQVAVEGYQSQPIPGGPQFSNVEDVLFIDLKSRKVVREVKDAFPTDFFPQSFAVTPDGNRFAVGFLTGGSSVGHTAFSVFDSHTGKQLFAFPSSMPQRTRGLAYTPDGRFLIVAAADGKVLLYDAAQLSELQSIPMDNASVVTVSRDSKYVAIAADNKICVWKINGAAP